MTNQLHIFRHRADEAKYLLARGEISYDEAIVRVMPFINRVNIIGKQKAEEFGVPYRRVNASSFLR